MKKSKFNLSRYLFKIHLRGRLVQQKKLSPFQAKASHRKLMVIKPGNKYITDS